MVLEAESVNELTEILVLRGIPDLGADDGRKMEPIHVTWLRHAKSKNCPLLLEIG